MEAGDTGGGECSVPILWSKASSSIQACEIANSVLDMRVERRCYNFASFQVPFFLSGTLVKIYVRVLKYKLTGARGAGSGDGRLGARRNGGLPKEVGRHH